MPYLPTGTKLNGVYRRVSHSPSSTLKICHFAGHKRQYSVFLQSNLLNPGPFDQLLLLKTRIANKIFAGQTSDTPQNILKVRPCLSKVSLLFPCSSSSFSNFSVSSTRLLLNWFLVETHVNITLYNCHLSFAENLVYNNWCC